jgi:hypothetical protein
VVPATAHWVSEPLVQAVAVALPEALAKAGFAVTEWKPFASAAPSWGERLVGPAGGGPTSVEEGAYRMAVAASTDVALVPEAAEGDSRAVLRARVVGTVSRRTRDLEVTLPAEGSKERVAQALAQALVAKLTPELWGELAADGEGRQRAAVERYTAGLQAQAAGMYQDAALELAAALAGQPENPDFLQAAAGAYAALERYPAALALLRHLAEARPDDRELQLRIGELSLLAHEPARAEAAFLKVVDADPSHAQALEGVARAARARGDLSRAEIYYAKLLTQLGVYRPARQAGLGEGAAGGGAAASPLNEALPSVLVRQGDDTIRLTSVPADAVHLPIARAYLRSGRYPEGVSALLSYHTDSARPDYGDREYLELAAGLDEEGERIAQRVAALTANPPARLPNDKTDRELEALHQRSQRLAGLAERMGVSSLLEPAHRYWVLAYNLLNQSDFEALLYFRTHDRDRQRRADFWRQAFRTARTQARLLAESAMEGG